MFFLFILPFGVHESGSVSYTYDQNGNLTSGGGRTYVWNAENKPTSITSGGVTETYQYDADGNRVTRTRSGVTTVYGFGAWERVGSNAKKLYSFNGRTVAQRDGSTNAVIWLHPDHQGGTLLTTNQSAGVAESLWFTPWGAVAGGSISQTKLNYTGQRLDDTGLLFYNARYYDPAIGRFVSADTIVPGAGSLTMRPGDATETAAWIERGVTANPQELNRYSYGLNNPVKNTDPSGHVVADPVPADPQGACATGPALCGTDYASVGIGGGGGYGLPRGTSVGPAATTAGTALAYVAAKVNDPGTSTTVSEARSHRDKGGSWEKRKTTDGETVRVRRLGDKEVRERGLHSDKGERYRGKAAVYEDEQGNLYVGGRGGGQIEPEF